MKVLANKWWYAMLVLVLFAIGDVATSINNFAVNLKEGATFESITFKEWLMFGGGSVASLVLTIRGLMSNAWNDAHKSSQPPPRTDL